MAGPSSLLATRYCPDVKARYYFGGMVEMAEAGTRPEIARAREWMRQGAHADNPQWSA